MASDFISFRKQITSPLAFRMYLLTKLPAAFFAGLKVHEFSEEAASIRLQQKWFNKNPFHSIYFAVLAMAGEVSTGILCLGALYKLKPAVSMLVIKIEGFFYKKATAKLFLPVGMETTSALRYSRQYNLVRQLQRTAIRKA